MAEEKALTIYDAIDKKGVKEAIANLIKGKTPIKYVKQRPARGGGNVNYVETYYIVDQLNKLFGFRWNFEVLDEKSDGKEVIVKGRLTAFGGSNSPIVKEQFGQVDRVAGVPLGDQKKAASSDCLKKCASLFGIALDIYWGKEVEYFATEEGEESSIDVGGTEAARAFGKFLSDHHIPVSKALSLLNIKSLSEIENYKEAFEIIKKALEV